MNIRTMPAPMQMNCLVSKLANLVCTVVERTSISETALKASKSPSRPQSKSRRLMMRGPGLMASSRVVRAAGCPVGMDRRADAIGRVVHRAGQLGDAGTGLAGRRQSQQNRPVGD